MWFLKNIIVIRKKKEKQIEIKKKLVEIKYF
jgi:hypothetical protein